MRIVIVANHSYPHVGGTEIVIQSIAEGLSRKFGHKCFIISKSLNKNMIKHNGVKIIKCYNKFDNFLGQLESLSPDRILVYSDCFCFWPDLLKIAPYFPNNAKCSLFTVGLNFLLSKPQKLSLFKDKKVSFQVITHSDNYIDYIKCKSIDIPVNVVHNGVDLSEFVLKGESFKKKYKIKTKKIVLCVSNFFPGKGQDYLLPILNNTYRKLGDFTAVFICTSVNFFVANNIKQNFQRKLKQLKIPSVLLLDIPRQDVVNAFLESDVFVFPSLKEVAPVVILEAMSAKLPWIALPVGNIPQLSGGMMVPTRGKNSQGFYFFGAETQVNFEQRIVDILTDTALGLKLGQEGRQLIEEQYNWDVIIPKYNDLFL